MTEIRIAISPETLAMLEMSMSEGDTYDSTIKRLIGPTMVYMPEDVKIDPDGMGIIRLESQNSGDLDDVAYCRRCDLPNDQLNSLAKAALKIRDDIAKSLDFAELYEWSKERPHVLIEQHACSAVMKTENLIAFNEAVKAVFDE